MHSNVNNYSDQALSLLSIDGLGAHTLHALVHRAGGIHEAAEAVLSGESTSWLPETASSLLRERMERIEIDGYRWSAEAIGASIITVMDDSFPNLLLPIPACPALLWYVGDASILNTPSVAVVGSRRCSKYGKQQAALFSTDIVESGLTVVSGGARGIDSIAHRSTLRIQGKTIAVLGSGIGIVYPPEHKKLFESISTEGGVLVSEYPCHRTPRPTYFPRRNRIVSGLSSSVLVVEAAIRSGALITARIAVEEQGRDAFAIPGRLGDRASAGCIKAIREGWVELADSPMGVIEQTELAWSRLSKVVLAN